MESITGHRERWNPNDKAWFEYHCLQCHCSQDAQAWYRSHQQVTVLYRYGPEDCDGSALQDEGVLAPERAEDGAPVVYRARFADGHEHDVCEDELLISPDFFSPECGPPPDPGAGTGRVTGPPKCRHDPRRPT